MSLFQWIAYTRLVQVHEFLPLEMKSSVLEHYNSYIEATEIDGSDMAF